LGIDSKDGILYTASFFAVQELIWDSISLLPPLLLLFLILFRILYFHHLRFLFEPYEEFLGRGCILFRTTKLVSKRPSVSKHIPKLIFSVSILNFEKKAPMKFSAKTNAKA
jgi:hypothetical protein